MTIITDRCSRVLTDGSGERKHFGRPSFTLSLFIFPFALCSFLFNMEDGHPQIEGLCCHGNCKSLCHQPAPPRWAGWFALCRVVQHGCGPNHRERSAPSGCVTRVQLVASVSVLYTILMVLFCFTDLKKKNYSVKLDFPFLQLSIVDLKHVLKRSFVDLTAWIISRFLKE